MTVAPRAGLQLAAYASGEYSQLGEEGVIAEILSRGAHQKYVIDVGAWDGRFLSNSLRLFELGYRGLLIEADPERAELAKITHADRPGVQVLTEFIHPEKRPLSDILDECGSPREPALLTIDIDSTDYLVFESLGAYRPLIVCVEYNCTIPNHVSYVQRDEFARVGNSALALTNLAHDMGYVLVHANALNLFFVPATEAVTRGLMSLTVDEALDDSRTIRGVWVGYDGRPFIEGNQYVEFPWSNVPPRPLNIEPALNPNFATPGDDLGAEPRVRCQLCGSGSLSSILDATYNDTVIDLRSCAQCGHWTNVLGQADDVDDERSWQARALSGHYANVQLDTTFQQEQAELLQSVLHHFPNIPLAGFVDVGAGKGGVGLAAARAGFDHVAFIEPARILVAEAARLASVSADVQVASTTSAITSLPIGMVWGWHVLEHVNSPVEFIRHLRPMLIDGAMMVFQVPQGLPRYVGPAHVSFFTERSIHAFADCLELQVTWFVADRDHGFFTFALSPI